jgi:hypothetical protein
VIVLWKIISVFFANRERGKIPIEFLLVFFEIEQISSGRDFRVGLKPHTIEKKSLL